MDAIKNRYDFVFLFDVKDGNPNGDPDFDNMPRTDEETNQGIVTDVCIKRKVRNYVCLLKKLESPYDIFIREGNVLNSLIKETKDNVEKSSKNEEKTANSDTEVNGARNLESPTSSEAISADEKTKEDSTDTNSSTKKSETKKSNDDEKKIVKLGREAMCAKYFDIRTFGAVMSTEDEKVEDEKAEDESPKVKDKKDKKTKKKIKGLGVVRGPVQFLFARSIDPVFSKSYSITRCCITKEADAEDKNNTIGNKNIVNYGLYRMHGFISAADAVKTGFSEEDKKLLFEALANAFENDHSAARGEMNPRALIVFKHESCLGNARAGQLFDLIQLTLKEGVEYPRSFNDYEMVAPSQEDLNKIYPGVTVEYLI